MTAGQPTHLDQLKNALASGIIDQGAYDVLLAAYTAAQVAGGGAIAQGAGALAVGAGSAVVGGDNSGIINLGVLIQQASRPGASATDMRRAYLARILTQANQLPLFVGDGANAQLRLSAVYMALLTRRSAQHAQPGRGESAEHRRLSALAVLNQEPRLVLLGGPGSGKSTFINFVALSMAGELLGLPELNLASLTAPAPGGADDEAEAATPQRWDRPALLPVHVVLRDLVSQLPAPGTAVGADRLWRFIRDGLEQAALGAYAVILEHELHRDGGLILLDGLDEVPDAGRRREQIKQVVQDFAASFSRCRFLVTSRSYAYQRQDWKLDGFAEVELADFAPPQIEGFIDAWYRHMSQLARLSELDAQGRGELLKRSIGRNPRLAELAARPLLLTLIARLHTERGGALPEKREELYAQAVELLLNQWENLKVRFKPDGSKDVEPSPAEWLKADHHHIRRELDKLAFEAHRDQAELVGTADIPQARLIQALLAAAPLQPDHNPRQLEAHLRDRAGLLAAHGEGFYQFPHRSFQEYLATCHLTVAGFPDQLAELARAEPNRWREVALLAAAKAARGTPEAVWSLVEALCPVADPPPGAAAAAEQWGALLAAQALWETGLAEPDANIAPRNELKRKRVQRWLRAMVERGWLPLLDRATVGKALSLLGDERELEQLLAIPAGEFEMGDDDDEHARPRHRLRLDAFSIGRYPVTNAQYQCFVVASARPWRSADGARPERRNHPVTDVTWHDALAYCEWLGEEWRREGKIGATQHLGLPSEAEWERAARGTVGDEYPWGDDWREDHANTAEAGLDDSSAVGLFPQGQSAAGCADMAGNVWEWTRSLWGKDWEKSEFGYPYVADDAGREALDAGGDVLRLIRGGTRLNVGDYARCAARFRYRSDGRGRALGFRVVLRSAPVARP